MAYCIVDLGCQGDFVGRASTVMKSPRKPTWQHRALVAVFKPVWYPSRAYRPKRVYRRSLCSTWANDVSPARTLLAVTPGKRHECTSYKLSEATPRDTAWVRPMLSW